MEQQPESDFDARRLEALDDYAESRRVAQAHTPHLGGEGEASGSAAPTVGPHFFDEDKFREKHAISRKVWSARPYIRYEVGDSGRVREHWPQSPQFASLIANQASGIIIPRYAPASLRLGHVPAELRPDREVKTKSWHHYHGDDPTADLTLPSGKRLKRKWILQPEHAKRHIEKVHGGVNVQTIHPNENWAKYVFPTGEEGAQRLDVHPQAWARFVNASRVFFGIEGCIKADAMLSAGEAVFSVPSVTLWRAPELASFAGALRGKVVYIVPDADGIKNDAVITQALFCRTYLRKLGVDAYIAAPPFEAYKRNNELKGVDDHLFYGGTMDDLDVFERETAHGLAEHLAERGKCRFNRIVRNADVLENLALHAGEDGEIRASLRSVARIMGFHHSRVQRGARDLQEWEAIEIDGDLGIYARYYDPKENRLVGWDWEDQPVIRIAPKFRAKTKVHKLGG
jgi:hypothetical protein